MSRILGVCWGPYSGAMTIEEHIDVMKKNGFGSTFLGSENADLDKKVKTIQDAGIFVENFHAPFDKINDIWKEGADGEAMTDRLAKSIESCARLYVPALVVHLSSGLTPPPITDIGHARWKRLVELADSLDIKLCFENQRKLSNLAYAFENFPSARFCWDCGHESCFTPGRHYMPLFGSRLSALHIHDNIGKFNEDNHMVPGDANMDFDYVAEQIALSGYEGPLLMELIPSKTHYYDNMTYEEFYAHAAEAGRRLLGSIELKEAKIKTQGIELIQNRF